ncbi:MAG TPA: GGDEF domain-containing protein, partial [Tepidisphaeraceae bacterium]|nr:GGDEF domain-containing protein [Tepidisphaeraceae bacterium]
EPLERRPEVAVKTLRQLAGDARLLLFGHPTLEILSRKMLEFGCDDYVVTPASAGEFEQIFGSPPLRISPAESDEPREPTEEKPPETPAVAALSRVPLAEILLDSMLATPHDALTAAVNQINARIATELELRLSKPDQPQPEARDGHHIESHVIRGTEGEVGTLHLFVPASEDPSPARHALSQIGQLLAKLASLQDRHNRLQRLAITDELTGSYNARYFRHFLASIIERARKMHFPVTLLLFDIDDFKKYNDQFGHGTGDEILRQAAALMRRCTRQHDLVARIGGDEFAVVFWDKEGPRQPRDPKPGVVSRPPQQPLQVFERFKRLIASEEFPLLGQTGKGSLTVSAGLAVFPWDANDPDSLVREADKRLMLGAKKQGKNTIHIVGTDEPAKPQS